MLIVIEGFLTKGIAVFAQLLLGFLIASYDIRLERSKQQAHAPRPNHEASLTPSSSELRSAVTTLDTRHRQAALNTVRVLIAMYLRCGLVANKVHVRQATFRVDEGLL